MACSYHSMLHCVANVAALLDAGLTAWVHVPTPKGTLERVLQAACQRPQQCANGILGGRNV